jgi:hypothetical protein
LRAARRRRRRGQGRRRSRPSSGRATPMRTRATASAGRARQAAPPLRSQHREGARGAAVALDARPGTVHHVSCLPRRLDRLGGMV